VAAGTKRAKATPRVAKGTVRGRLRASDPFELIRWLALSQPDPRKALAELVQNSLDAGAGRIRITRIRERGHACLKILDDGEGVIPDLDRSAALRYIATHIGHSRKRSLSPKERLALMTQGQYGIGLLGFWSLGETLEMRSQVDGHTSHRLVLHRDRADFVVEPLRGRLPLGGTWTEVVVVGLHREAMPVLTGRRAADYLAVELRGQLLSRQVEVEVEDRMSRGRAPKRVVVRPPRFLGERIEGIGGVEVPGYPPIRLELYLSGEPTPDGDRRGLAVYAAGTLVAEGFQDLAAIGLDRPPWTDERLSGFVDFAGFQVSPGSRRGVVPDAAAGAFAAALASVEPALLAVLEQHERRREEEIDRGIVRDLQRAFRDFYRQRPRYAMLPIHEEAGAGQAGEGEGPGAGEGVDAPASEGEPLAVDIRTTAVDLLPPGPLASVRIVPRSVQIECGGRKVVRALALDAAGRPLDRALTWRWEALGAVGQLEATDGHPERTTVIASEAPAEGTLRVTGQEGGQTCSAEATVEVLDQLPARGGEGIPEPDLVHLPSAPWRSRMHDGRWQVNAGHREYRAIADRPALKLRYLAMLFAKEIVLRSSQDPRLERPLEQLVEVASFADRNISSRGGRRRREDEETVEEPRR